MLKEMLKDLKDYWTGKAPLWAYVFQSFFLIFFIYMFIVGSLMPWLVAIMIAAFVFNVVVIRAKATKWSSLSLSTVDLLNYEYISRKLNELVDTRFSGVYDESIGRFAVDIICNGHKEKVISLYRNALSFHGFAEKVVEATGIELKGVLAEKGGDSLSIYQFVAAVTQNNQWEEIEKIIKKEQKKNSRFIVRTWKKFLMM